jgi:stress response protein SCP2
MANYKIKKYNGANSPIPELVEHSNTVDNSTSLMFYSKGYDYGTALNTNMLRLMEHFCSFSKPANPVMGQIWFDNLNKVLSVYNGVQWDAVATDTMIPKDLQWSGSFTQINTGTESTISGSVVVNSTTCLFKTKLTNNSNQALSPYNIVGNIPTGLTVNVITHPLLYNHVLITCTGSILSSSPAFNFKVSFTSHAFTNVFDISEVNNSFNTLVVGMGNPAPTTTTTSTTAAPTTTTSTTAAPITTTSTTAAPTTTTSTTAAPITTTSTTASQTTTTTTAVPVTLGSFSSIKLGITWGGAIDLDTVVAAYDASGVCTAMNTITHPDVITGVVYGGDITTGGVEEYYNIDLTQLTCTKLVLGILEYTDNSFVSMTSLSTRIVDNSNSTNIAQFNLTTITKDVSNTPNTTCIVGVFTKVGSGWTFSSYQKLVNSHVGKHAIYPSDNYSALGL